MDWSTRRRAKAGLVASLLVVASACGNGSDDSASGSAPGTKLLKADASRETPPADAPVEAVVAGVQDFALKLAATSPEGNLVVSPVSIAVAFAMAEAGAGRDTVTRIANVFGFPPEPGVHEAWNALAAQLDAVNKGSGAGEDNVVLELANAVWGQHDLPIGEAFLDVLARSYGTGVQATDFANVAQSRATINRWVAEVTRDRIPELVPAGMIMPDTLVMLVNAIYLKAAWRSPFVEGATADRPFHLADGSTVDVPTMARSGLMTGFHQGDGYTAVSLPYVGGDLAMVVVVPDRDTSLSAYEAGLTGAGLGAIVAGLTEVRVDLQMPRFETSSALDLARPLSLLGLPIPGSDMSRLAPGALISAAVHAANITVDEKGTEAAAATAVAVARGMLPPDDAIDVHVDRPFLYLIVHEPTGTPLFYGRITDPTSG